MTKVYRFINTKFCNFQLYVAFFEILQLSMHISDTGYPHDGRADNAAYRHDRRADKRRYPHDREIDIQMLRMFGNGYILS